MNGKFFFHPANLKNKFVSFNIGRWFVRHSFIELLALAYADWKGSIILLVLFKMYSDKTKKILEDIIRGSLIEGSSDHCTAIRNYLCAGFSTSTTVKKDLEGKLLVKKEQESSLRNYAITHQLWINHLPWQYLTRGGESQVYFDTETSQVIKINDAVYYAT